MGWAPGLLVAALVALAGVRAQLVEPGICPFSTPLGDWNEAQFVAEPWYEIKAFALPGLHDARPGCTRWHFTPSHDGLGLHARLAYRASEGDAVVRAFAQYVTSEKLPRFNMTFHDLDGVGNARSVDMKLVATDYDEFALLWGCTEPNLFERKVVSWVLSRRPFLSENAQEALRSLYRRHDIKAEKFFDTDQDDQTCGAPASTEEDRLDSALDGDSQANSVFGPFRNAAVGQDRQDAVVGAQPVQVDPMSGELGQLRAGGVGEEASYPAGAGAAEDGAEADEDPEDSVSWSYVGSDWPDLLSAQGVLVAVLLALAVVTLVASLLTFRALMRRVQRQRGLVLGKPVLPVHRQDVVVATLGSGVDYSRFGGLGQGLVQTRKHQSDLGPRQ